MVNDGVAVYIPSKFLNHKIRDEFNPINPKIRYLYLF